MTRNFGKVLNFGVIVGMAAILLMSAPAWGQLIGGQKPKEQPKAGAKDPKTPMPKEATKDNPAPKDAKPAEKDAAKPAAKDAAKPAEKDTAKASEKDDAKPAAKDAAKPAEKDAREATKDDATKETAKPAAKDKARDARETAKDTAKDTGKEATKDDRKVAKEPAKDAREGRQFRAEDVRSADIGIWFGRGNNDGLVISDLSTSGAIANFGFREGDRIVSINGQRVVRDADFIRYLFADDVRDGRVKVIVLRDGSEEIIYVEPAVFIEEYDTVSYDPLENFGLVLDDRDADRIVVWKVVPRSPAFYAGLRAGDVITTFHGQRVGNQREFVIMVEKAEPGSVTVEVKRGKSARSFDVDISKREARVERRERR